MRLGPAPSEWATIVPGATVNAAPLGRIDCWYVSQHIVSVAISVKALLVQNIHNSPSSDLSVAKREGYSVLSATLASTREARMLGSKTARIPIVPNANDAAANAVGSSERTLKIMAPRS